MIYGFAPLEVPSSAFTISCSTLKNLLNMVLDPLSALSLAGNVVQFIEYSCSILSESRKYYQSATRTSSENIELENVADSLRQFSVQLQCPKNDQRLPPRDDEAAFANVLASCWEVANELLQAVQRLKAKDGTHKRWNSFRQALVSVWNKDKLLRMQSRLAFLREQVTLHLVSTVRSDYLFISVIHHSFLSSLDFSKIKI